jgi:hypothetical protein
LGLNITLLDAGGAILDRRRTHKMYFKISVIYYYYYYYYNYNYYNYYNYYYYYYYYSPGTSSLLPGPGST